MFFKTRARKKKCLTDPIQILPFPGQSLRKEQHTVPIHKPNNAQLMSYANKLAEQKKSKIITTVGDKLVSTNLSIKKLLKPDDQESKTSIQHNLPVEDYSFDELKQFWRQFANLLKEEGGQDTFYNALIKRNPKSVEDHLYSIEVENLVQIDVINRGIDRLIEFLRKSLKNHNIRVIVKLSKEQQNDIKTMNNKDKFAILSKKFPNIQILKDTFRLDIEY